MHKASFGFSYVEGGTTHFEYSDVRDEEDPEMIDAPACVQLGHCFHASFFNSTSYESVAWRVALKFGTLRVIDLLWSKNSDGVIFATILLEARE